MSVLRYKTCIAFVAYFLGAHGAFSDPGVEGRFSVAFAEGYKCVISRDGKDYMTIDLARFATSGEDLLGRGNPQLRPVSPRGRYIPFIIQTGGDNADIVLVDLAGKTASRRPLYGGMYFLVKGLRWVGTEKLEVREGLTSDRHILYSVDEGTSKVLAEDGFLTWDATGENSASNYGKMSLYRGRVPPEDFPPARLLVSEATRYNSYWVYPKPLEAFMSWQEYVKWRSDISVRESGRGPQAPPIIRTRGVALSENHIMTPPVFVGDTSWVAFFEVVFPLGRFDVIQECNAVLLDAHRVHTNPPLPQDISIMKQAIPQIVDTPSTKPQYVDLVTNIFGKWNEASSSLEFWRTRGWHSKDRAKKLGEIPIDLARMEFGQWKTVQSDWISLDPSVPASEFSSQKQSQNR